MARGGVGERELRIAPVMTGGTSLAIWMGGATAELYRLVRSRKEPAAAVGSGMRVYRGLLELTGTEPVVDVITGTSAGGLNGVLLAAATYLGVDAEHFMDIRGTWLAVANLEELLRSEHEPNPPSLLEGDEYVVPALRRVLDGWVDASAKAGDAATHPDVDLVTTVTTLAAEPRHRTDDFGEVMAEVDHAQCLHFDATAFGVDRWTERLAIAARTSASIPGVFEASFLPVGAKASDASGRPDFAGLASFGASRWAVDGGTVVNLPLTEALDRIFARPATEEVRRVALYVCPTPSGVRTVEADEPDDVPTIRESLTVVVTAPRAEGVSADIDRIRRENARVDAQRQARRSLGPLVDLVGGQDATSEALLGMYHARRATGSVAAIMEELRAGGLPRTEHDELIQHRLVTERIEQLPGSAAQLGDSAPGRTWSWETAPVEQAVSIALGILGRSQRLVTTGTPPADGAALAAAKETVHRAREMAAAVRRRGNGYWRARAGSLVEVLQPATRAQVDAAVRSWVDRAYEEWLSTPGTEPTDPFAPLLEAHRLVASALLASAPAVARIAAEAGATRPPPASPPVAGTRTALAQAVDDELRAAVGASSTVDEVQHQLLRLHIAQTIALGEVGDREQTVELMQVSWHSYNALDGRAPADKLAGPELARLGAFVKPSWRANDWFWGRMDGAHRLVLLVLDPRRLRQLGRSATEVREALEALVGAELPAPAADELAALDDSGAVLPRSFPETTKVVAGALQVAIAQEELPRVAEAVRASRGLGANEADGGTFLRAVDRTMQTHGHIPAAEAAILVQQMQIGAETVRTEIGFRLLNRLGARAAALAVNALTGTSSGLPFVARLLRPLRAPLHGVNSLVRVMTGGSLLARAVTAFVLAAAGAIVAVRLAGADVPSGTVSVAAILLVATLVGAMLRSGFVWLGATSLLAATVIGLALAGPGIGRVLFDEEAAVERDRLGAREVVRFEDGGVLRVTVGEEPDDRVQDIEFDGVAEVLVRDGEGAVRGATTEPKDGWKRWGFTDDWSAARVVAALVAVIALGGLLVGRRWKQRGPLLARLAIGVAAAAVVYRGPRWFEGLLTGRHPATGSRGWKARVADAAEQLHEIRLELLVVVLVGASLLLALGTDIAATKAGRRLRTSFRRRAGERAL